LVCRAIRVPRSGRRVLWADLKYSESSCERAPARLVRQHENNEISALIQLSTWLRTNQNPAGMVDYWTRQCRTAYLERGVYEGSGYERRQQKGCDYVRP